MPARLPILAALLLATLLPGLAGCCGTTTKPPIVALPPPLTLSQQLFAYNTRARSISLISAGGRVKLTWLDHGKPRTESADAKLFIQQRYGQDALQNHGGDLFLTGRVVGGEVFQVGKNPQDTWFLVRLDTKTAWTAKTADLARSHAVGPFRADLLVDLLGISALPVPAAIPAMPDEFVIQRYPVDPTHVELLVFRLVRDPALLPMNDSTHPIGPDGRPQTPPTGAALQRCITLDRLTNLPQNVTVYDPNGEPLIVASLSDYRDAPALDRDGNTLRTAGVPPKFPGRIEIHYPRVQSEVILTLDEVSIPAKLPPTVFTTPNFADEGLKILPIE